MKLPPKSFNPNFEGDLRSAGLAGLPFSWGASDSDLNLDDPRLTPAQKSAIMGIALRDTNVPAPPGSSREDQLRFLAMKDAMPGSVGGVSGGNTGESSAPSGPAGSAAGDVGFDASPNPNATFDSAGTPGDFSSAGGKFGGVAGGILGSALGALTGPAAIVATPALAMAGKSLGESAGRAVGGLFSNSTPVGPPSMPQPDPTFNPYSDSGLPSEGPNPNASLNVNTGQAGVSPSSAPGLPGSQTATAAYGGPAPTTARGDQSDPSASGGQPSGTPGTAGSEGGNSGQTGSEGGPGPGGAPGTGGSSSGDGSGDGGPSGDGGYRRGGPVNRGVKGKGSFKGAKKFAAGGPVSERQTRASRVKDFEAKHGKVAI